MIMIENGKTRSILTICGPTLHIEDYGGVLCVIILEKSIGYQSGH